ncbi:MAG: leucine-rich repeat domain-containing protein [Clostridia bacterium]
MKTKVKERQKGITLIALVITIIVLLILAGVSIAMLTGDNGILNQANDSKIETAVGTVKEQLKLLQGEKIIQGEKVTPEALLAEGKVKRTVRAEENDKYYMYYALKENSLEGMQGLGKGDLTSLKDVFLIDDDLNVRYIASNGKEYGDQISKKILEDETEIRFSSKAFSEYVSKISGVAEGEMKFKWMKNQTKLVINDANIDNLQDLVFFPNLIELDLGGECSQITTMDGIENCTQLEKLYINSETNKNYMAIIGLSKLKTFYRSGGNDFNNIIDALKFLSNIEEVSIIHQKNIVSMKRISELGNLKTLFLTHNGIKKIEGLENKSNIINLNLDNNEISKIEGLENLLKLKIIYLGYNKISDITPLSANTSLMNIKLLANPDIDGNIDNYSEEQKNKLKEIGKILDRGGQISLDIDKLKLFTNYTKLDLTGQNLTTLEAVEGLTKLEKLILRDNKITLEDEKSQNILESMSNLDLLDLSKNKISSISAINNLHNLKRLELTGNDVDLKEIEDIISQLDVLKISTNTLKTIKNCDVSKITKLNILASELNNLVDLSTFINLKEIDLTNNANITNFDEISKIYTLQKLTLSNNKLHGRMIEVSKLINLKWLDLSGNTLWSEDLENLKGLKDNTNLIINLKNNSIIDATALLELNPSTRIDLKGNVNLSQDSKDKLKAKFGNNVTF